MARPSSLKLCFVSRDFELLSIGQTLKSLHSTVCRVGDVVLKVRSLDVKSAKEVKEHLKEVARSFDFLPDFLGVVVGAVEIDGEVKPAVVSLHSYAEPINLPTLKDLWEVLVIIVQAQAKGYALDIKPSNFGRLRGRVVYVDEYGIGKPLPKDISEDLEGIKRKVEQYFKQVSVVFSEKGSRKADTRTRT
ncbi:MAG: hypothetical protein HA491_03045 [Candidatus Verstraetearchaeota archaeon]|nr:hypothetical protein [Candidatus Verstraetearchaeota archaeon]